MTAMKKGVTGACWFGSGTPTYLTEMLRKYEVIPQETGGRTCMDSSRGGDVRRGGVRLCRVRHMAKALKPPSTTATVPVTNAAASLIR